MATGGPALRRSYTGEFDVDDYRVVGREGRGQWLHRTSAGLEGSQAEPMAMRLSRGPLSPLRAIDIEFEPATMT